MDRDKLTEAYDDCVKVVEQLEEDSEKRLIDAYERDSDTVKPDSD